MVADLNLLGSVGDLYCFSNTFSMLLYVAPICCPSCFIDFHMGMTDKDEGKFINLKHVNPLPFWTKIVINN